MKLLELDLIAYGPFTGVTLDLSPGDHGLHIVYGANEAGKSTTLRALHALLYGIPERTADVFVHDNKDLRLGGRVRHSDGEELVFVRRKGRRNTLLGTDGQPIGDDALARFLAGVESGLFRTMFGIDHERLVQGSLAILQDSGEVGKSLLSAGLGGVSVRSVIDQIDDEAADLFRPRGQKQAINSAVADYKQALKELRGDALSGRQWAEHDKALRRAQAQQRELLQELAELTAARDGQQRLLRALPNLNRRRHELQQIETLGDQRLLSEDFPERRREIVSALEAAHETLARSTAELQRLRTRVQEISVPDPILERAGEITDVHQRLGSHRKATRDRAKLRGQLEQLQADAESLGRELRPDAELEDLGSWRLTTAQRARIRALASGHATLVSSREHAGKQLAELEARRAKMAAALENTDPDRDGTDLARVVAAARKLGAPEDALSTLASRCDVEEAQIEAELERLDAGTLSAAELEKASLPSLETIDRYEQRLSDVEDEEKRLAENLQTQSRSVRELRRQIDEQQRVGDVPGEDDLARARELRDDGWRLIRRAWLDGEELSKEGPGLDAPIALAGTYEKRVLGADDVSDRLRREADRVAKMAELAAGLEEAERERDRLESGCEEVAGRLEKVRSEWSELWATAGISAASPREMRAWTASKERLLERIERHRELRAEARRTEGLIAGHRDALHDALLGIGEQGVSQSEGFGPLLDRCGDVLERIAEHRRFRSDLEQRLGESDVEISRVRAECERAEEDLASWRAEWASAVQVLDLAEEALPGEALAVLEGFEGLISKIAEIKEVQGRIQGIDRDAEDFERDLTALVGSVAPELARKPAEEAAERLHSVLSQARSDAAILANLEEQLEGAERACTDAEKTIEIMTRRRAALCEEAGCSNPDELPDAEQRSADLRAARHNLRSLEEQLVEHSGMALEHLLAEAENADPVALKVEIEDLGNRIAELEKRRSGIDQTIGSERQALEAMDGGDRAAVAAERAQSKLAEIRTHVHRYMRLRLASAVLQREIERYRSEHQAPLLRRAGELFSTLSLGSFESLGTTFDDKDQPVLEGVRGNGERVGVDGMSSGTRDQLYLALRLASLEKYLDAGEPMPFVVDDILMSFDDHRASAALRVLGDLSKRTQVLFFTHHHRLVDLATRAAGDLVVHHSLRSDRLPAGDSAE